MSGNKSAAVTWVGVVAGIAMGLYAGAASAQEDMKPTVLVGSVVNTPVLDNTLADALSALDCEVNTRAHGSQDDICVSIGE